MKQDPTVVWMLTFALATACWKDKDKDEDQDAADDGATTADDAADAEDSSDGGESSDGSYTGADVDALWECDEATITEFRPLGGPGYDPMIGGMAGLIEPLESEYIVGTTKVIVHEDEQAEFLEVSDGVTAQLEASPGMVAYGLAFEPTCGFFRTLSVYRSQEEMMSFVYSDAHMAAIGRYSEFAVTGKTTAWVLPADQFPPSWGMADEYLAEIEPF